MVRSMLFDSNLPSKLWAEAMFTAVYLANRLFIRTINKTPFEYYFEKKTDLSNIKESFSDRILVHVTKEKRNKLEYRVQV